MSWGHDPPLSGSVAVQGSGSPFVHGPFLFTGRDGKEVLLLWLVLFEF